MKAAIMQPYFFPYIGYWQLIQAVDKYVIYDDVNYIKGGWIHRNNILLAGERKLISMRLKGASQNKLINQVEILEDEIYSNKLLRSIELNYKKAPNFDEVYPVISEIICNEERNLAMFLENSIRRICNYLTIDTEIIVSSMISKNNELKGEKKVIEICRQLEADEYINAIGGQTLYSHTSFERHGINLKFLKTGEIRYHQFGDEFIPNLSIIDILMFNSKENILELLGRYELVQGLMEVK